MPHKRRTPLQPLHFYHLEDLLYQFVCEANALVDGDGCSLFLWDEEVGRFVLRESTKMSPFIGRYCLDHNRPPGDNCGITSAVLSQKGVGGRLSPNVRRDRQWTWWGKRADGASEPEEHCELARKDLLSMIVLPLHPDPTAPGDQPAGVLRVVKKRGRTQFNVADKTRLENMTERNCSRIFGARSLSRLIELGSALDQRALCEQAVGVLSRMLSAKGCSIFLLDGARSAPPTRLVYSCEATTGLDRHQRDGSYVAMDSGDARYELPEDLDAGFLTAWVLHQKRNLFLDDLHSPAGRERYGIKKRQGPGKFSEALMRGDKRIRTGSTMSTPLFFRERFDPDAPAMGVLRLTRPSGSSKFRASEQRWFLAFAERLSKALLHCRYLSLLNYLSSQATEDDKLTRVVMEVPRLIGGHGCSLFLGNPILRMRKTVGKLERLLSEGKIEPYDLRNATTRGYTGWVAHHGIPIVYNDNRERLDQENNAAMAGRDLTRSNRMECEVDEKPPTRFLAIPISIGPKRLGVIRLAKTKAESPFAADDVRMLQAIADRLGEVTDAGNTGMLRYFVPEPVVDAIRGGRAEVLHVQRRCVTICFWDIRGFSELCSVLGSHPELIAGFIKDYFRTAAEVITRHGGLLDKFIGDGVMALFGAIDASDPAGDDADSLERAAAHAAIDAAREMRERFAGVLDRWEPRWKSAIAEDRKTIGLGAGISTGAALVGNMGTDQRMQYTALGPEVNLASRIESRAGSGEILISQTTFERLDPKPAVTGPRTMEFHGLPSRRYKVFSVEPLRGARRRGSGPQRRARRRKAGHRARARVSRPAKK